MARRQVSASDYSNIKPVRRRSGILKMLTNFALFLALFGVLALMLLIFPREPQRRATASVRGSFAINGDDAIYDALVISEIMASNKTAIADENGKFPDYLEIWNTGSQTINIAGVGLSDREDRMRFVFPQIELEPDARQIVFASNKSQSDPDKPLHANFNISSNGETIVLFNPAGVIIDRITTPPLASDEVYHRRVDGQFSVSAEYSPGYPNTEQGYSDYLLSRFIAPGTIVINEVMAKAAAGLKDEDGDFSDWIELYNNSDYPVAIGGCWLSNKTSSPLQWRIPEGTVIPAHGYYIIFCSSKDRQMEPGQIPHSNFNISAEHATIVFSDSHARELDRITIDNMAVNMTYGRDELGDYTTFKIATPGAANKQ